MLMSSRRSVRVAGSLVAAAALALSGQGIATAAPSAPQAAQNSPKRAPIVIPVRVTTNHGFRLPHSVHAGLVTFRISTPEVDSFHAIQGFYLNHGVTLGRALADIRQTLSDDPAMVAAGVRRLTRDVTEVGGVVTNSYAAQEVTIPLDAGTYYWFDLNDYFIPLAHPRLHRLDVVGKFRYFQPPRFSTVIEATMENGKPRFHAPRRMAHNATFLNVVSGDELHESVFRPTRPGITDRYISRFYNAIRNGDPTPPASPWTGGQSGLQAMSPGRWAIVHINLPPGPYALICYVPSDENGLPHGWMGMHLMMNLT